MKTDLFHPYADFLDATLSVQTPDSPDWTGTREIETEGARVTLRSPGILSAVPLQARPRAPLLIISAGVHGNETAPIEILNQLASEVAEGRLLPQAHCLFLLGNPPAIEAQQRFLDSNLNRLFSTNLQQDNPADRERPRAALLMRAVSDFVAEHPDTEITHYDLHTAIRGSYYETFALAPFVPGRQADPAQVTLLGRSKIQALLHQNQPATTFSAWTSNQLGAESFTLELGRVAPFGENDLARLANLVEELTAQIEGETAQSRAQLPAEKLPIQFQVVEEIINSGNNFQLNIAEDTPNFTPFDTGALIWKDDEEEYRIGEETLHIVFPNSKVGPGQRAGLLVKPMAAITLA